MVRINPQRYPPSEVDLTFMFQRKWVEKRILNKANLPEGMWWKVIRRDG